MGYIVIYMDRWFSGRSRICIISLLPSKTHLLTHQSKQALTRYTLIIFDHLRYTYHVHLRQLYCFYCDSLEMTFNPFLKQQVRDGVPLAIHRVRDGWSKLRFCGPATPTSVAASMPDVSSRWWLLWCLG